LTGSLRDASLKLETSRPGARPRIIQMPIIGVAIANQR
jgi:hypothetical protein